MRVLVCSLQWKLAGGLEMVARQIAYAFAARGDTVEFWGAYDHGSEASDGVRVVGLSPAGALRRRLHRRGRWRSTLGRKARKEARDFDLIVAPHIHLIAPLRTTFTRTSSVHPPVWCWLHGREVWGPRTATFAPDLAWVQQVVSVSKFTADQVAAHVPAPRLQVIPNAVDISRFNPLEDRAAIQRDEILIVGRLARQAQNKGYDTLMRALPHAEAALGAKLRLRIVGDGDYRAELEILAKELGVAARVEFAGRLSDADLIGAYQRCGAYAMPSRIERGADRWFGEGFGIVYIEAAACGRPIIASADGGAAETVHDGVTGLVVDPRNPQAIGVAIADVLRDPQRSDAMGAAGRAWVQANFTIERFRQRLNSLVNQHFN